MDNAGEGTLGTGLWERKFEQKKPFTLLSVSSLIKKKTKTQKTVIASCWDRDCIWGALGVFLEVTCIPGKYQHPCEVSPIENGLCYILK